VGLAPSIQMYSAMPIMFQRLSFFSIGNLTTYCWMRRGNAIGDFVKKASLRPVKFSFILGNLNSFLLKDYCVVLTLYYTTRNGKGALHEWVISLGFGWLCCSRREPPAQYSRR